LRDACRQHRLLAIRANEYVLSKTIAILLQQVTGAEVQQIPVLLKASSRCMQCGRHQIPEDENT